MRADEFEAFKGELKQLCATLGKAYSDALGQAYWRSLKDVPFADIEANVGRILLAATKETKFPKPGELRNDRPKVPGRPLSSDPDFVRMEQSSARIWDERLREDPELAGLELRIAKTDRMLATEYVGSVVYAEALRENSRDRAELQRLREHRRSAVTEGRP